MRILAAAVLVLSSLPLLSDRAEASPEATDLRRAVPVTAPSSGPLALRRNPAARTWQQLAQPQPKRQPAVGQYSCIPCCDPCWRWSLSIPIWIPGIDANAADGDVTIEGDRPDGDLIDEGGDIFGDLEFAFVGAVAAHKGRWGFGVDFLTATIEATANFTIADGLIEADATGKLEATIARARIDYLYARSTAPWKFGNCGCAEHRVFIGARAYDIAVRATALGVPALSADVTDTWVDPIIGLDSRIPFARNWSFLIAGDVGGWSIDGNWSWNLIGGINYRFANRWGITVAYNMLDINRAFGPPSRRERIDLFMRGPQLALHFYL